METSASGHVRKVTAESTWVFILMWAGFPVVGAGVLWGLSWVIGWLSTLEAAPFKDLIELAASTPEPYLTIGALAIGALLGLGVAFLGHADSLKVTIEDERIVASRGGKEQQVATADVTAALRDGKYLVLLDGAGAELLREKSDIPRARMRQDFIDCGFTWHEEDPHKDQWRRWVDGTPDLPKGANALLRTRAKELKKMDPDLIDVNAELRKLGVMVRDEKSRQHWRLADKTGKS
ncbi:MAG: YqeB family protein [Stackebrandtia sp.]